MFDGGLVGMPTDDGGDACRARVKVDLGEVVQHVEAISGNPDDFCCRKLGAGACSVDVAADGGGGREGAEGFEDLDVADVSGMKNMIDAAQSDDGFGTEQAVGVRDNADAHGLL